MDETKDFIEKYKSYKLLQKVRTFKRWMTTEEKNQEYYKNKNNTPSKKKDRVQMFPNVIHRSLVVFEWNT